MKKKKFGKGQIALHLIFVLISFCYIYPLLLLVSISLEGSQTMSFSVIPNEISFAAYRSLFEKPIKIIKSYMVTGFYSTVGVFVGLVVMSTFAYALSKRDFKYRNIISFLLFFTTLFHGGMVPSYLVNARLLHLNDTIWIYIIPGLISAWNVIVLRTFFQGLPEGLNEAARIDGASELRICFQIVIPLATPALASIGFMNFIVKWNDWSTAQVYIRNPDLYSLQYLLKIYLDNEQELRNLASAGLISEEDLNTQLRTLESLRFAMAVVASAPMVIVFPYFQKYFAKGLTIGSVKG